MEPGLSRRVVRRSAASEYQMNKHVPRPDRSEHSLFGLKLTDAQPLSGIPAAWRLGAIFSTLLMGGITLTGFIVGGPIGAAVGAIIGFIVGLTTGVATALQNASERWLRHRLICLGDVPKCAVGTVAEGPNRSDLGPLAHDD